MAKKANEEEIRERFVQFQVLQQHIEQLNEHLEQLNRQQAELDISIKAVEEIGKTKVKEEILSPLANGIFLKGELKDNKTLTVNVGSDITVERTIPEVVKLLEQQKKELVEKLVEASELLQGMSSQAMEIYQEVQKYVGKD